MNTIDFEKMVNWVSITNTEIKIPEVVIDWEPLKKPEYKMEIVIDRSYVQPAKKIEMQLPKVVVEWKKED